MVYVDYRYYRKRDNKFVDATMEFDRVNKAIRFIHGLHSRGYQYLGFSCDSYDELEDMESKI